MTASRGQRRASSDRAGMAAGARNEDEIAALREATREAHEAAQALKDARRAARETLAELRDEVQRQIDQAVTAGLEDYRRNLEQTIEEAIASTFRRFDTIADILLGEDAKARRKGQPSLAIYAERVKARAASVDASGQEPEDDPPT